AATPGRLGAPGRHLLGDRPADGGRGPGRGQPAQTSLNVPSPWLPPTGDAVSSRRARSALLIPLTLLAAAFGCCSGGLFQIWAPVYPRTEVARVAYPLPHHLPRYPGNLTFRFVM